MNIAEILNDYYTHKQAAEALGVTKKTLWKWIRSGKLEGHRIAREVLIEKAEVNRLKEERSNP